MAAPNPQPPMADELANALNCLSRASARFRAWEEAPPPAGMAQVIKAIEELTQQITEMREELGADLQEISFEIHNLKGKIDGLKDKIDGLDAEVQALP